MGGALNAGKQGVQLAQQAGAVRCGSAEQCEGRLNGWQALAPVQCAQGRVSVCWRGGGQGDARRGAPLHGHVQQGALSVGGGGGRGSGVGVAHHLHHPVPCNLCTTPSRGCSQRSATGPAAHIKVILVTQGLWQQPSQGSLWHIGLPLLHAPHQHTPVDAQAVQPSSWHGHWLCAALLLACIPGPPQHPSKVSLLCHPQRQCQHAHPPPHILPLHQAARQLRWAHKGRPWQHCRATGMRTGPLQASCPGVLPGLQGGRQVHQGPPAVTGVHQAALGVAAQVQQLKHLHARGASGGLQGHHLQEGAHLCHCLKAAKSLQHLAGLARRWVPPNELCAHSVLARTQAALHPGLPAAIAHPAPLQLPHLHLCALPILAQLHPLEAPQLHCLLAGAQPAQQLPCARAAQRVGLAAGHAPQGLPQDAAGPQASIPSGALWGGGGAGELASCCGGHCQQLGEGPPPKVQALALESWHCLMQRLEGGQVTGARGACPEGKGAGGLCTSARVASSSASSSSATPATHQGCSPTSTSAPSSPPAGVLVKHPPGSLPLDRQAGAVEGCPH